MAWKEKVKTYGLTTGLGIAGAAIGEAVSAGIGGLVSKPRLEVEIGVEEELRGGRRRLRRIRRLAPSKRKLYHAVRIISKLGLGLGLFLGGYKVRGTGGEALKAMGIGSAISSGTDIVRLAAKGRRLEDLTLELVAGGEKGIEVEVEEAAKEEETKVAAETGTPSLEVEGGLI